MLDPLLDDNSISFVAELLKLDARSSKSATLDCPISDRYLVTTRTVTGKVLEEIPFQNAPLSTSTQTVSVPHPPRLEPATRDLPKPDIAEPNVPAGDVPAIVDSYASPLAPLRERDLQAMAGLFDADSMYEIESDVTRYLLLLWPEPCWDESPFEFLQEYL